MGLFDFLSNSKVQKLEQEIAFMKAAIEAPRHFREDNNLPYREDSYRLVNGEDYLTLYENHVPTYACVDAIARNCAKIPMKLYRKDLLEQGKKKHEAEVSEYDKDEVTKEIWKLLYTPNPFQTNYQFRYALMATAELNGMAYVEKGGDIQTRQILPSQLWVLRTDWMRSVPSQTQLIEKYMYQTQTGAYVEYQRDEIFEYKYWHPRSEFYGLSPIRPAQNSVIVDLYCIKYAKQFFKNGGHISKYVSVKEKLTTAEFERMAAEIQTFMGGLEQAHKIPLMEGGAELKEIGENPEGAALPKTRSMNLEDICQTFGVPPIILGLPNNTHYNNADAQKKVFYEETVIPKNLQFITSFNQTFLEPLGFIADFDYSSIDVLQPNIEKKATTSVKLVAGHIMTPNEVRKEFWNLDPLADGDTFPSQQMSASGALPKEDFANENGDLEKGKLDSDTIHLIDEMVNLKLNKRMKEVKEVMTTSNMSNAIPQGGSFRNDNLHSHNHTKPTRKGYNKRGRPLHKAKFEALKKTHVAHTDKTFNAVYPVMETAVLNGWKSLEKKTLEAIHSVKKSTIIIKKDFVESVLGSMDGEVLKMMDDLNNAQQEQLDKIISMEESRTGRKLSSKKISELKESLSNSLTSTVNKGMGEVSNTIKDKVKSKLEDSLSSDMSGEQITKEIQNLFQGTDYDHAKTIARTESIKYINTTKMATLNQMGYTQKQWYHSGHSNARPEHEMADGEIQNMEDEFSTGLMYPGDPDGEPEDVINCGCTFAEYVDSALTPEEIEDLQNDYEANQEND